MTDRNDRPEGGDRNSPTAVESLSRRGRRAVVARGPRGVAGVPVVTAGLLVAGGVLAAGVSVAQMSLAEQRAVAEPSSAAVGSHSPRPSPSETDAQSKGGVPDKRSPGPSKPVPDVDEKDVDKLQPLAKPQEPRVYRIKEGDTLSEISGMTGVPVGLLVEANRIQNPNLIYAGASLLIPPTS